MAAPPRSCRAAAPTSSRRRSTQNFAAFLAAFAQRYGTGLVDGSGASQLGTFWRDHPTLTPQPVLSYEIWNEINLAQYAWNATPDPVAYTALLKAIRPVLRAEQPAAIMLGDLAWQDTPAENPGVYPDYAAALGAAGGLQYLDAMGFHPYAPDADSIFTLIRRLRGELDAAGSPDLPIYANEAGLPADFTGPGIQFAADIPSDPLTLQFPSDAARASSLEFAGEALADSDCGVDQFLPYAITGDESTSDPIHEGFMGMIRKDGTPTKTILGLENASLRWRARFAPGGGGIPPRLQICGAAASPDASLLTIPISITGAGGGCVDMIDTYDGNPMESAVLTLVDGNGTPVALARSDAYGHAHACAPDPNMTFKAYADIPKAGMSGTVLCDVPGQGCPAGVTLTPSGRSTVSAAQVTGYGTQSAPTPAPQLTAAQRLAAAEAACPWTLTVAVRTRSFKAGTKRSRVTVAPLLKCPAVSAGTAIRFSMSVHRKGRKSALQTRSVFLRTGQARTVDVVGSLTTTDTIAFTHVADAVTRVPRISTTIRIGATRASEPAKK